VPTMRGDEERVVAAYVSWLERNGWTVSLEVEFADLSTFVEALRSGASSRCAV
jgi:hypothetical protein